jgi:hypothetical protein
MMPEVVDQRMMPALLTDTSTPPKAASTASNMRATARGSLRGRSIQRLRQVLGNVLSRLDPHGHADQGVTDT